MTLRDFRSNTQITGVIDLSKLPPPVFYEKRSFEQIFAGLRDDFLRRMKEKGVADFKFIDSDPSYVMAEAAAYEIMRVINDGNYNATQTLAAYARGSNLDNVLLNIGAVREELAEIDPATGKPLKESDEAYLRRALLTQDRFSTAGSFNAYQYHVFTYCTAVLKIELVDVKPSSPEPGDVLVPILLSKARMDALKKDPGAGDDFIEKVAAYLNSDDVKPLTDSITVKLASVVEKPLGAVVLRTPRGVSPDAILKAAIASLKDYREKRYAIAEPITVSGIHSALTVSSDVIEVTLKSFTPSKPQPDEAYYLTFADADITVTDSDEEVIT